MGNKKFYVEKLIRDIWVRLDWFCSLRAAMDFCDSYDWLNDSELRIVCIEIIENELAVIGY